MEVGAGGGPPDRCGTCSGALDLALYARCEVCDGRRLCLACAAGHFCTAECPGRGCLPGLCVHLVRDGLLSEDYGV